MAEKVFAGFILHSRAWKHFIPENEASVPRDWAEDTGFISQERLKKENK